MLSWCGDKLYAHEALRKAAVNIDLGIMGQLFTVVPTSLDPDSTAQSSTLPADTVVPANVFQGILEETAVQTVEAKRGITLLDDQKFLLEKISKSGNSILSVPSLAGTGKTMLMTVLLELLLPQWAGTNSAAVFIVPSRSLRDELVRILSNIFPVEELISRVIWLGRPSQELERSVLWEDLLEKRVYEELAESRMLLKTYEAELREVYLQLAAADLPWSKMLKEGLEEEIPLLAQFKDLAKRHMKVLATTVMRGRDGIIERLLSKMAVRLVVAAARVFTALLGSNRAQWGLWGGEEGLPILARAWES